VSFKGLFKERWFISALIARFLIAPFVSHPFDGRVFMIVGAAVARGISPYYKYVAQELFPNVHVHLWGEWLGIGYPPLWGLVLGVCYYAFKLTGNIFVYQLALKIPVIIGDLAALLAIKHAVENGARKFFTSPFVLLIGAVWGMFDSLVFALTLYAITSALKGRSLRSALSLGLAVELKIIPGLLLPLTVYTCKSLKGVKEALKHLLLTLVTPVVITVSIMKGMKWSFSGLFYALTYHVGYGSEKGIVCGGVSPFSPLKNVIPNLPTFLTMFLNWLWLIAYLIVVVFSFRSLREKLDFDSVLYWSIAVFIAFFAFRPWVSEQNIILPYGLLLVYSTLKGKALEERVLTLVLTGLVLVHVPFISFLWILVPETVNIASKICDHPVYGVIISLTTWILAVAWILTAVKMLSRRYN